MNQSSEINLTQIIVIAAIGGFVLSMMNLWEDSKKDKPRRVPKDFLYWLFFCFWPVAGGGLSWLYFLDGSTLRPLLAFSIGLTAPTTIQAMINRAAKTDNPPPNAEE
ncbi:MAG TPA: hypothetical protein VF173_14120 [Thermoanaerobaculia bacterium]|nr:hypothetical protein [Thermoanaerobaculia bacterium]